MIGGIGGSPNMSMIVVNRTSESLNLSGFGGGIRGGNDDCKLNASASHIGA